MNKCKLGFGIYKNKTYAEVYDNHKSYVNQHASLPCKVIKDNPCFLFKKYIFRCRCLENKDIIDNLINDDFWSSLKLHFGWHARHTYASIYIADPDYCQWILNCKDDSSKSFRQWLHTKPPSPKTYIIDIPTTNKTESIINKLTKMSAKRVKTIFEKYKELQKIKK